MKPFFVAKKKAHYNQKKTSRSNFGPKNYTFHILRPKRKKERLIKVAPLMKQPLRLCTKHQLKWIFESVRLVIVFEEIIEPPFFVVLVIPYF